MERPQRPMQNFEGNIRDHFNSYQDVFLMYKPVWFPDNIGLMWVKDPEGSLKMGTGSFI